MLRLLLVLGSVVFLAACQQGVDPRPDDGLSTVSVLIARSPVQPYPAAVEARLFVETGRDADGGVVFAEPEGRVLTDQQRQAIARTLTIASYDREPEFVTACFVPHHFVRYYDANATQIGELAVCFCCEGIEAKPDITGSPPHGAAHTVLEFNSAALATLIHDMGLRTDFDCGET